jgi:hypothetical protein
MISELGHNKNNGHRSMPGPDPQVAPVMPGSEIASQAVLEMGASPVPGVSSDTHPEPVAEIKSAVELVRLLRKAGLSKAAAKAVAAGGWKALQALSTSGTQDDEITALMDAMAQLKAKLEDDKND